MGSKSSGFCDLGFAKVDIDRKRRRGFAEAIYCPGKTRENIKDIARQLIKNKQDLQRPCDRIHMVCDLSALLCEGQ